MSDFQSTLAGMEPEEALAACEVQREEWRRQIAILGIERDNLPRHDKQGAHEKMAEIHRITSKVKSLRPIIQNYRADADRQLNHSLWTLAVRELFGDDAPRRCYDWMKAERKRRRIIEGEVQQASRPEEGGAPYGQGGGR